MGTRWSEGFPSVHVEFGEEYYEGFGRVGMGRKGGTKK